MSTPPTPGRGGRWPNAQQAAFNNPQGRGRGPRQQGRGAQQGRQAQTRGRGTNQRGGFTGGRGRGTMNMAPQQMNAQFVVRPGGLQQPQFPGSIPSAPTQQVVMVPNHLLQQAVSPYPIAYPFNQNNIAMQQGVMPQFAQQFVHPQQQAAAQAMLLQQQQQNAARLRANQQNQQQQQAAQQQQQAANQATNRAAPGKPAPTPQTSSPPQQATPANQMPTQNQPQSNQPSATPIHPMNANQQQQFVYVPQVNAYGHQQFFMRKGMQPQQIVNPAMMNPMMVQQQQALMQQQAMMQRAQQAAAQQQARNLQQQQQAAAQQQQHQQQQQDKDKPKQPQAVNYMQLQPQMYANQPQVRVGGPIPQMAMAQPNAGANQPGWTMGFQQANQTQRPNAQQPNATGAQPSRPPTMQNQQVPSKPPQVSTLISKPPTSGPSPNVQAEMMKKFKQAAVDGGKAASPGLPKKGGTPLSATAAVFVPGSFSSPAESPAPSQPPQEMNKKDPAQQQQPMAMPAMIPPTIVPSPGVPAENPKPQQPVASAWNQPKPSQPPPAAKTTAGDAEANVLNMFDPGAMKKVQEKNNVGPEDMAELVQPTAADPSDITSEDVQDKEEISSPRSQLSVGVDDSETVDDENEEEENKADELDVENRIYTISQLIKLAKDTECQEIHEVLKSSKYSSIKAHSCVAVHDIIDSSRMNSRRRPSKYHNQGGISRAGWGTGINKKRKTPRNKNKPGSKGRYDQYPPLLRVDPLEKDMNNSWWATHRKKNSPLDTIRKKSLALLNKLTLENKETICEQFTSHIVREVKSTDECNVVVSTIFEKSCAEAKFSNLYADLCHVVQSNLSGVKPNLERENNPDSVKENEDMKGLFRRSIINLCQLNFNRRLSLDPIEGSDEEIITQLDNTKRKMMGNIKFIGDLFKHKLIHESIVHHIIAKLLTPRDKDYDSNSISRRKLDDQLEGCCRLLQTVGKQIDVPKAKEWIDQYFDYMIHYQKNAQNRIHFMVLEIKELRENRWVPRRETETVKLKEEVRKEFEREQMEKARGQHKGKRGVKPTARKPNDFRDNRGGRRNDNTIRGSTSGGNAWGRNRTPSSAPKMKKSGSQDIRGSSYSSVRSPNPSRPPQSGTAPPISRKASSAPAPINIDALQKEWDEFGNSKRIPEAKLDKFLNAANNNPAAQKARWSVFFKHFVCNAQAETQKQMMTSLRFHNRSKKVNPQALLQCLVEVASKVEVFSDDFDVPKAAEYYGYLVSELVITQQMQVQDVISKFAPKNLEKETFLNMYMTGVLKELATCEEPDGPAFIEEHAKIFAKGFRQNPNEYGKPAKRNKIPTAQELPIIEVVLGTGL